MQKSIKSTRVSTKKPTQSFTIVSDNIIRDKAKEIHHRTGNTNADENWFQAKKELGAI